MTASGTSSAPAGSAVTIVIPLFNQVHYTRICVDSLRREPSAAGARIVLIDNGSTDDTGAYLDTLEGVEVIRNRENLGCAGAWNQGVRESATEWTAILNNDVIVAPGWLDGLLLFAAERGVDVVCPAMREGEYDYDIAEVGARFMEKMKGVVRLGETHGVCFMVHRRVFEKIGGFDENFRIGQFEDADFFRRASLAGFRLGMTGGSFLHHFGSVTQNAIRKKKAKGSYEAENRRYYRAKWKLTWWRRLVERRFKKCRSFLWCNSEKARYGDTLIEKLIDGKLRYF